MSWRRGWGLDGQQVAVELYDYQKDPNETKNVAENPEYAEARSKVEALLRNGPAGS